MMDESPSNGISETVVSLTGNTSSSGALLIGGSSSNYTQNELSHDIHCVVSDQGQVLQESFQKTVNEFMNRHSGLFDHLWSEFDKKRKHKTIDDQPTLVPTDKYYLPDVPVERYFEGTGSSSEDDPTDGNSFLSTMMSSSSFNNPSAVDNLKVHVFGVPSSSDIRPTLLECLLMKDIPDNEYSEELKNTQRREWSMELTGTGIKYFKSGQTKKANEFFDFALSVDHSNVECLVARGALKANIGLYEESIMDFDDALDYNSLHKNARKYMIETCIAYGNSLQKSNNVNKALELYEKVVALDSSCEQAIAKVAEVSAIIRRQVALKEEVERREYEEKMKLRKLKKIIRKEKRKMEEFNMHGPQQPDKLHKKKKKKSKGSSGKKHHSRSSTRKRKRYSSSSSTTD